MTARDQQQQIGKRHLVAGPRGERVDLEMVNREERPVPGERDGLDGHHADEDAADEAGPGGGGDPIQLRKSEAGLLHRLRDQPVDVVEVAARSNLRHHAAVRAVLVELREDEVRSEEHTSELQSLMRISYAVFCLKKNKNTQRTTTTT